MIEFLIFITGLCIGSFVNVLGDRLAQGKDILTSRSICDHCKRKLQPFDLIPVLSYILLSGKCRYCNKKISLQYPIVEFVVAFGFLAIYYYKIALLLSSPFWIGTIFLFAVYALFIAIVIADSKYLIIPNSLVFTLTILSFIYLLIYSPQLIPSRIITAIGAFIFLWLIYFITKGKGMGFGDVKYSLVMGLLLGYPEIIIAFYIAFLTGAIVGIILLLLGKARFGQHIPFGPFLVFATIVSFVWKDYLLRFFLNFFF